MRSVKKIERDWLPFGFGIAVYAMGFMFTVFVSVVASGNFVLKPHPSSDFLMDVVLMTSTICVFLTFGIILMCVGWNNLNGLGSPKKPNEGPSVFDPAPYHNIR